MARIALLVRVRAEQWESSQAVVEEDLVRPGVFVVAVEAAGSLRTIVGVVFFMAGETAGLRLDLEDWLDVAGLAFDKFVRTIQRMVRVDVVVEMNRCPCVGGMAGFAGAAEVTVMVVVFEVTRYARDVHLVVERIRTVAVGAA